MKHGFSAAGRRDFLHRALTLPLASGVIGAAFVSLGLVGVSFVSPQAVQAGTTCVPNASYAAPTLLPLASLADGLHIEDRGAATYAVGGNDVASVRAALDSCAVRPGGTGEYLASTDYAVNWDYTVVSDGTACRLAHVKVGLRTGQLMPRLVQNEATPQGLSERWAAFSTALVTHENGHKDIDVAQATKLFGELSRLHGSCASINVAINRATAAALSAMVTDNDAHDVQTDHGRTQGAVW